MVVKYNTVSLLEIVNSANRPSINHFYQFINGLRLWRAFKYKRYKYILQYCNSSKVEFIKWIIWALGNNNYFYLTDDFILQITTFILQTLKKNNFVIKKWEFIIWTYCFKNWSNNLLSVISNQERNRRFSPHQTTLQTILKIKLQFNLSNVSTYVYQSNKISNGFQASHA